MPGSPRPAGRYYTTATEDSYKTKAIPESMSFSDIHNIGKKDTKSAAVTGLTHPTCSEFFHKYWAAHQKVG